MDVILKEIIIFYSSLNIVFCKLPFDFSDFYYWFHSDGNHAPSCNKVTPKNWHIKSMGSVYNNFLYRYVCCRPFYVLLTNQVIFIDKNTQVHWSWPSSIKMKLFVHVNSSMGNGLKSWLLTLTIYMNFLYLHDVWEWMFNTNGWAKDM